MLSTIPPNTTRQAAVAHDRQIRDMFAGIADVYDRMNGLLSLGLDARWRRRLAESIDPQAEDLLDLCCGTGELILTAKAAGKGRHHVAADFCEPMLRAGVRNHALDREASLAVADSQRLPFADESFDVAMAGFGLRNLGDLRMGVSEIARVLRPSGQLLVLEFFRPPAGSLARPVSAYVARIVPLLGRLVGRDGAAYSYLPESMGAFVSAEEFAQLLRECGFAAEIGLKKQSLGIAHLVTARRESA